MFKHLNFYHSAISNLALYTCILNRLTANTTKDFVTNVYESISFLKKMLDRRRKVFAERSHSRSHKTRLFFSKASNKSKMKVSGKSQSRRSQVPLRLGELWAGMSSFPHQETKISSKNKTKQNHTTVYANSRN